jgi:hypothetical protein
MTSTSPISSPQRVRAKKFYIPTHVRRRVDALPDDSSQRLAFVALIVGPHLRMQEHSDRTNQPMLPVMSSDDRYTLDSPMVVLYKPSMTFESRNILPAFEPTSIDQQSDLSMLLDERVDLRGNLAEIVSFQFLRCYDPQRVGRDSFCLDHANLPGCHS